MRKVMTKKQRRKKFNDIKIITYYIISRVAQVMTVVGIILWLITCAADIRYNETSVIIGYLAVSATLVVVSNFIATRLSEYLYKKHAISKSRVIDSIFFSEK